MVARFSPLLDQAEPSLIRTDVVKGVNLPAEVQALALWRQLPPLPMPQTLPFQRTLALQRLSKVFSKSTQVTDWSLAEIAPNLSPNEAVFWFRAMTLWCNGKAIPDVIDHLTRTSSLGSPSFEQAVEALQRPMCILPAEIAKVLVALFGGERVALALLDGQFLRSPQPIHGKHGSLIAILEGMWLFVRPYLQESVRESLVDQIRPRLGLHLWPNQYNDPLAMPYYLAALMGMHEDVATLVQSWKVGQPGTNSHVLAHHAPLLILMGLNSPKVIDAHVRALRLPLKTGFDLRAWFAITGVDGLDYVAEQVQRLRRPNCKIFEKIACIQDPAAAVVMLSFRHKRKHPSVASDWLHMNVGSAVAGLLPVVDRGNRLATLALDYLLDVVKRGYGWVIERELANVHARIGAKVRRLVLETATSSTPESTPETEPAWIRELSTTFPTRVLPPSWLDVHLLPPIIVEGRRLRAGQIGALLAEARQQAAPTDDLFEPPKSFLHLLREHADPASLDHFVRELTSRWVAEKNRQADLWVLGLAGSLGGDATVDLLCTLIRRWPGGHTSRQVKDAISAVRMIGTAYAITRLSAFAFQLPNRTHREHAATELALLANTRHWTTSQLEDRAVPTFNLETDQTVLDYGSRKFRFTMGSGFVGVALDERGKAFSTLPPSRKTDHTERVIEAKKTFSRLNRQLAETVTILSTRLEHALIHQRRWTFDEFDACYVRHPLLGTLARRFVWAEFDGSGHLHRTFRITEDGEFSDHTDRCVSLGGFSIGLPHPVQLSREEREAWLNLLADYELTPPFAQLTRPVYDLHDLEQELRVVQRFNAKDLPGHHLNRLLKASGWVPTGDQYRRTFPAANVTAFAQLLSWRQRELHGCRFLAGGESNVIFKPAQALPLGSICPIVRCEVFADLESWSRTAQSQT